MAIKFLYTYYAMIVTALPRTGATKFCIDLAKELGLEFVGQIDRHSISHCSDIDKQRFHETSIQPELTFEKINDVMYDHSEFVVLNNNCNPALFYESNYFITRRDVKMIYHSLFTFIKSQHKAFQLVHMRPIFKQLTFQIGLFNAFIQNKNHGVTVMYSEDLYPEFKQEHQSLYDQECVDLIEQHIKFLGLQ